MDHKISVLMSTYNERPEEVEKATTSILKQTHHHLELIIVCDNPDNSELLQLLEQLKISDSRVQVIKNEKNLGLSASLNVALFHAQGDYIARMDADDESLPRRLENQLKFLIENHLDLVGCYVECVNEQGETIYFLKSMPSFDDDIKKKIIYNNPLVHPTWLGKKTVFMENKGYRPIPYAEDYDFLLRAVQNGFQLGNLNQPLFRYTVRKTSISNSNGLKQYLVSQKLIRSFQEKQLHQIETATFEVIFQTISTEDEANYARASAYFMQAMTDLNQHRMSFFTNGVKACFTSKYYFRKLLGYVKVFL